MSFYLRPVALTYGHDAVQAKAAGVAGLLGGGQIGFAGLELIEGRGAESKRRVLSFTQAQASSESTIQTLLQNIQAPRAALPELEGPGPFVMGIVNVTPDSFSDGGEHEDPDQAADFALSLIAQGADILDIGGESTRPGAQTVPEAVELARVLPVIEGLAHAHVPLSIDTRKAGVMTQAIEAGAHIINDVTALTYDEESLTTAAKLNVPVILMHALDKPQTMQDDPQYDDVLLDIYDYLEQRIIACEAAGLDKSQLFVDPGIGFGKTVDHNLSLLRGMSLFHSLGAGVCLGTSRKGFIGAVSGEAEPQNRLSGSLASLLTGVAQGVQILRVHDVAETVQALAVYKAVLTEG